MDRAYQHYRKILIIFISLPDRGASLAEVPKPCLWVQLVYEGAESTADCPETGESVIGQVILSSNSCGQSLIDKVLEVTHICRTHIVLEVFRATHRCTHVLLVVLRIHSTIFWHSQKCRMHASLSLVNSLRNWPASTSWSLISANVRYFMEDETYRHTYQQYFLH